MATHTVRLHRVLRAPSERIYRAYLDADAMAKWLPPHGFTGKVHELDARVGGAYRMSFTNLGPVNANFAPALPRESDGCKARRAGKGNPLPSGATSQTHFLAATRRDGADSGACLCREPLAVPALRHVSLRGLHPESTPSQA